MGLKVETTAEGVVISAKVVPNSSRDALAGVLGEALKIKVAKPPEGGKANAAVEELLAEVLGIAGNRVSVVGGHSQAYKRILIRGMDAGAVVRGLVKGS